MPMSRGGKVRVGAWNGGGDRAMRYSPGDRFNVAIFNGPEFSGDYVINADGSVVLATYNNLTVQPVIDKTGVQYDSTKLNWIGSIGKQTNICVTWFTSPLKTVEQVLVIAPIALHALHRREGRGHRHPHPVRQVAPDHGPALAGHVMDELEVVFHGGRHLRRRREASPPRYSLRKCSR